MQHAIPIDQWVDQIGPQAQSMATAVETCVHCGFCLSTCPTYQVLGEEMDSPRGRILLMKHALEGELSFQDTLPFIDHCLGCLACVTACPSGVLYGELVTPYKNIAHRQARRSLMGSVQGIVVKQTLPYPSRFRAAATLGKAARPFRKMVPAELQPMLGLLPESLPPARPLPALVPAQGVRRARVALLAGCVQQVLAPEINWATLRVLARNGVEVVVPPEQACCGAVLVHNGDVEGARRLARQNLRAFHDGFDAVVANAAGCGFELKEYGRLFEGLPEQDEAQELAKKAVDVSVFLADLGIEAPPPWPEPVKIAYHDACHLAHAQGVTEPPRQLLGSIPNVTVVPVAQAEFCCGSAGTYNIDQPELAGELGRRKVEALINSGGDIVALGNIACLVQIQTHLRKLGKDLPVYHTLQVLDMAYHL
jgi:glycolate oxidase iron-sulfur subunit